jgi:hypothetical protein
MGTTLTGTTPQDTYDSLIKVTDNGPLSGTLKALSDGLGNDSTLSLSTTAASIAGTLAVTGNAAFDTNTLFVDAAANRVGVGTASPIAILDVRATSYLTSTGTDGTLADAIILGNSSFPNTQSNRIRTTTSASAVGNKISIEAGNGTTGSYVDNQLVLVGTGNVGIGLDSPASKLHIFRAGNGNVLTVGNDQTGSQVNIGVGVVTGGSPFLGTNNDSNPLEVGTQAPTDMKFLRASTEIARITANGLTFNGDTAAANALDDYEEGTWTGTLKGSTSDPSTAVTATGYYTKIGNRVFASIAINNANTSGAAGQVTISGLPFTSNSNNSSQGSVVANTYDLNTAAFTNALIGGSSTVISFLGTKDDSDWFDLLHNAGAGRSIRTTITYFV